MRLGHKKVKHKILVFILPVIVIALVSVTFLAYTLAKQIFMNEYKRQKEQVEAHVINAVNLIDSGFRMLEKSIEEEMEKEIREFRREFEKAGGDAEKVSLEALKAQMNEKFDLIIIDNETTIIKSTVPEALNFNFMKFDRKLGEQISRIRLSDEIRHERIRTNVGTGYLSKFTYLATSDHKYLLEIAYGEGGLSSVVSELEPLKVTQKLAETNPIVSSIRIFDVYGYEFVNKGENYEPTEQSLRIVERAKKEKKFEVNEGNISKSYFFIDLNEKKQTMTDNSKIIEIVYDNTGLLKELDKITYTVFTAGFIIVFIIILIIYLLSDRITQPITLLSSVAKKVAKGNFDVTAVKTSQDEIGELTDVFNNMIAKIKSDFDKIEGQKAELEDYSKNLEKKVEERTIELVRAKEEIYEERELFKTTLLSIGDGVISTDETGRIEIVNAVAEKLTGWTQDEAYGKPFEEVFNIINEDTGEKCENPVEKVFETGSIIELANHTVLISRDGSETPIEDSAAPIKDENGEISGVVLVFRDFTEKNQRQREIEYLSYHDQLTGLYNRRFLEEELKRLDCEKNLPLTLAMLDVNGLKLINDAFGHVTGDKVLQRAAKIMKSVCRRDDVVARIGGDEFIILLPGTGDEEVEVIFRQIDDLIEDNGIDSINMSISYGWATKRKSDEAIADVFKIAEDHMYRRKLSESRSMHYKTIEVILKTLHEKSEREKLHSERVSQLCEAIGAALGLNDESIRDLKTTGLMHDIGKIAIDLSILDKPSLLSEAERVEIERHPELGYQILRSLNDFAKLAEYVLAHHENWDGTGYPRKLKGDEIPLEARIVAVADAYDAMTSDRTYRKTLGREAAIQEILNNAGTRYDPKVVEVFAEYIETKKG